MSSRQSIDLDHEGQHEANEALLTEEPVSSAKKSKWLRGSIYHFMLLYSILACLVIYILFLTKSCQDPSLGINSPANEAVVYENIAFTQGWQDGSPYHGTPTPELDRLWDDLYQPETDPPPDGINLEIDAASAVNLPSPTLMLDGKKALHPEYYDEMRLFYDNGTVDKEVRLHYSHCIEHLRQTIMCHGDTTVMSYETIDETRAALSMTATHRCRNFDGLHDWAFSRWVRNVNVSRLQPGPGII
ncbi:oxidase ustYa family protein [Aspergillus ibericus CBS 121593]|uniref:Tat pathway signal sequence n=1 Tax=Aspergillus ibericus CBS 121593 TaxID=1448316 RepID=A0A395HBI1_9EURO|nr:hypothetical protein BO80DRAFT_480874 [Aspergillus ibericus CBS 121593]RAL04919.1 hypothetical protein BO80DRAFT_480874 [Aspergillus ibericus CBS 121593]